MRKEQPSRIGRTLAAAALTVGLAGCTPDTKPHSTADTKPHSQVQTVGAVQTVPGTQFVAMYNINNAQNFGGVLISGGICETLERATVKVKSPFDDEYVLLTYNTPLDPTGQPYWTYGSECPDGIEFLLPNAEFASMTERYQQILAGRAKTKSRVEAVLAQGNQPTPTTVTDGEEVDSMNFMPIPMRDANGDLVFDKDGQVVMHDSGILQFVNRNKKNEVTSEVYTRFAHDKWTQQYDWDDCYVGPDQQFVQLGTDSQLGDLLQVVGARAPEDELSGGCQPGLLFFRRGSAPTSTVDPSGLA